MQDKRVKIKPIGCKKHVRNIARNIVARDLSKTLAALDRDYDNSSNQIIEDHRVIYTHGYSIENDMLTRESLLYISEVITRQSPPNNNIVQYIDNAIQSYNDIFRPIAKLDFGYFSSGHALLDRDNPGKAVVSVTKSANPPFLNKPSITKSIHKLKSSGHLRNRQSNLIWTGIERDLIGKIWKYLSYHFMQNCLKQVAQCPLFSKDHYFDLAMSSWRTLSQRHPNDPTVQHYRVSFEAIG
jgi:hypothetical protein